MSINKDGGPAFPGQVIEAKRYEVIKVENNPHHVIKIRSEYATSYLSEEVAFELASDILLNIDNVHFTEEAFRLEIKSGYEKLETQRDELLAALEKAYDDMDTARALLHDVPDYFANKYLIYVGNQLPKMLETIKKIKGTP